MENVTAGESEIFSLNNTRYVNGYEGVGMKFNVLNNSINVDELPSRFDLRDWGWVTPVKDQGNSGACWVFGTTGAIESAILKNIGIAINASENNIFNNALAYSIYGHSSVFEPGSAFDATGYVLNWFGIILGEYDVYDELGKISPILDTNEKLHVQDCIFLFPENTLEEQIKQFKWALIKYGGINVFYRAEQNNDWINEQTAAQYNNHNSTTNHAVTLVGWDDNYSRLNFNPANLPPGDGAWIIKSSWGTQAGDNGYYYISYYDISFGTNVASTAYCLENNVSYNKNYQYDFSGYSHFINSKYGTGVNVTYYNIYHSIEDDLIAAVGTYFLSEDVNYKVEIYVNGKLKHVQEGVSPFAGFHTIKLDKYVYIEEGDEFVAVVTSNAMPYMSDSRQFINKDCSFMIQDGTLIDLSTEHVAACLKVYTLDESAIEKKDVTIDVAYIANCTYGNNVTIVVIVRDSQSTVDEGIINITFDDECYGALINDGIARFTIPNLNAGTYNAKINFKDKIYYNPASINVTFGVKPASVDFEVDVFDVYYGDTVKIKVNATSYGKIIDRGVFLFAINDKNYTADVNNGTATLEIQNLNAGTYNAKITFDGGDNYDNQSKGIIFNVLKLNALITASDKSFVINYGGTYEVTLKDNGGNVLSGEKVTFTLNGKNIGSCVTNAQGVASIKLTDAILKTAKAGNKNLAINFAGDTNYNAASKTVKITINKEKTKIVAKKKTFKKAVKVKKYVMTLKNSKGKAVKKAQVTLNIKGKTYKAKTNSKGKAVFKIKKLTKKGTFKSTIKFKGNAYYNAVVKKVKIIFR